MTYSVSAADLDAVRLNEPMAVRSVLQNIALILTTRKGTVPFYRDFGLDWSFLDKPLPVAKVMMIARVREAVERWEPRATVVRVDFSTDPAQPGVLIPNLEVEIHDAES